MRSALIDDEQTLDWNLSEWGITHEPGDHGKRHLKWGDDYLGQYDAAAAWDFLRATEKKYLRLMLIHRALWEPQSDDDQRVRAKLMAEVA